MMKWLRGEPMYWGWYECPGCKEQRYFPVHWRWHICEPCSGTQNVVQMVKLA